MATSEYRLDIVLTDQSEVNKTQLGKDQAKSPVDKDSKITTPQQEKSKFQQAKDSTAAKTATGILAAGIAITKEVYDYQITSAKSLGYDNKSLRMQEGVSIAGKGASIVAAGYLLGPIGAIGVTAYMAFDLAKQNRQNIININLDAIQSSLVQGRLIQNTTQRSR